MKKSLSFCFHCPLDALTKTFANFGPSQRQKAQKNLFNFIRLHKHELDSMDSYKKVMRKKTLNAKTLRIHIEMHDEYSNEFKYMQNLLCFYDFRQLFGKIFFGLPYKMPKLQNNNKINIDVKSFNYDKKITYEILDESIDDLKYILNEVVSFEESQFDWRNITVNDFPTIAREDNDFKAALIRFEADFSMAYTTKV